MNDPTAVDLLNRTEHLLSALHGSVARHDNLAANLGCAGCELRDQIRAALPAVSSAVPATTQDRAGLRDRIAAAMRTHFSCINPADPDGPAPCSCGWADPGPEATPDNDLDAHIADVVLAVLPAPVDRGAVLRDFLWRLEQSSGYSAAEKFLDDNPSLAELHSTAEAQAVNRAAIIDEVLPIWEAVYEPGNVSDYLIGYTNHQDAATGAAEAWMRSQAEVTGRLEWVPQSPLDGYDMEFELVEQHDDGVDTGPGITVRRRVDAAAVSAVGQTDEEA
ncbi:hypothetical protein [Streptomyces sp. NBC_01530]|uniref:hypothetical protein n=1 Tax=Streptomyces sp. NBC_01530 TaxID=2903895 RepID=UPI0038644B1C